MKIISKIRKNKRFINFKWHLTNDLKPWRLKQRIMNCTRGYHVIDHYVGKRSLYFVGKCLICHKKFTRNDMAKLKPYRFPFP